MLQSPSVIPLVLYLIFKKLKTNKVIKRNKTKIKKTFFIINLKIIIEYNLCSRQKLKEEETNLYHDQVGDEVDHMHVPSRLGNSSSYNRLSSVISDLS
jgi:hypothetical protein